MRIFHYILTGKAFAETRNRVIENTWLKRMGMYDEYTFIEGETDIDRDVFGSGTPEGPGINSTLKIIGFYRFLYKYWDYYCDFDWFFFSDSDCYVYPKRLKSFLQNFNERGNPLFVGRFNQVDSHPWVLIGDTHTAICPNLLEMKFLGEDS